MGYLSSGAPRVLAPAPAASIGYNQLTAAAQVTLAPLRNRFINSAMTMRQRGLFFDGRSTAPGAVYALSDGYIITVAGAAVNESSTFPGRITRWALGAAGAAGNTGVSITQRVEGLDTWDLANTPCVISGEYFSDTGAQPTFAALTPTVFDNWSASSAVTLGTPTISTVGTNQFRFVIPVNMPAGAVNGFAFAINFGAVTGGKSVSTSAWQLEKGSDATPLERRPFSVDYMQCRRRAVVHNVNAFIGNFLGIATNQGFTTLPGLENMRVAPAFVNLNGGVAQIYFNGGAASITGFGTQYGGAGSPVALLTNVVGPSAGTCGMMYTNSTIVEWRAEL